METLAHGPLLPLSWGPWSFIHPWSQSSGLGLYSWATCLCLGFVLGLGFCRGRLCVPTALLPELGPGGVGGTAVMLGAVAETVGTVAGEDLRLADAFMRTASPLPTVSQSNSVWLSVCQALPSCLPTRTTGTRHCRTASQCDVTSVPAPFPGEPTQWWQDPWSSSAPSQDC